jgi:hypothetical protein
MQTTLEQKDMAKLSNIAVHHSGGSLADPYASTLNLTPQMISSYHRQRWNNYNPSKYVLNESIRWAGYNVIYDPKTRTFTQCRALGEETMAQYGHNFDTFSLCIIGNYMKDPGNSYGSSVDAMTDEMEDDISRFLTKLINKDYSDVIVAPGTELNFSIARTGPHRMYQQTNCYGTALSNKWIQDLLVEKKIPKANAEMEKKLALYKRLLELYLQLSRLKNKLQGAITPLTVLGNAEDDHACHGFINVR